jgi:general stress protein 26
MIKKRENINRIQQELKDAGMTNYGFLKLETAYLPEVIHDNEHITGVIYGRLADNVLESVMLVATDRRIIFVDCKPFNKNYDEITFDVVAGINVSTVGPFSSVVLHTRVKDYSVKFVNMNCAKNFALHIESIIEKGSSNFEIGRKDDEGSKYQPYKIPQVKERLNVPNIILGTDTAILSTLSKEDGVHASVVHYVTDKYENFYILTKTDTKKAKNIQSNNKVALTIHQTGSLKALLVKGTATLEANSAVADNVYNQITAPRLYNEGEKLPPITKINKGQFIVFKISADSSELQDFSTSNW